MAPNYGPKITKDGLILCYDALNSKSYPGADTTLFDLSSVKRNGTLTNSPTFATDRFNFDGLDDYISVDSPSRALSWAPVGTTGNKTLSIEVWVKTTDTSGQIFSKPWNSSGNYNYRLTHSAFVTQVGTTHTLSFTSIADDTWKQVVAVVNATQKAVYVNGVLVAGFTNHGDASDTPTAGEETIPLAIMTLFPYGEGAPSWPQSTHAVSGSLASFKMYDRQLTDNEIQQNFNALKGRFGL
jgi:hypothetical protein